MDPTPESIHPSEDMGLLDVLITLAENIKLVTLGPLIAGALALGITFIWPQTFESVTVLQAEAAIGSLVSTAAVLDPVAKSLGMHNDATVEQARNMLRSRIKTQIGRSDKLLTLTVSGSTPAQAQELANAVLKATFFQSQPKGSRKDRLERQLAEARGRLHTAQFSSAQLTQSLGITTRGVSAASMTQQLDALDVLTRGSSGLLEAAATAQRQIVELEAELDGLSDAQIIQAPTLPEIPASPKKVKTAGLAAFLTGFVIVLFLFLRRTVRSVRDPKDVAKLVRLRGLLGQRP